jgi:hypothetical protein
LTVHYRIQVTCKVKPKIATELKNGKEFLLRDAGEHKRGVGENGWPLRSAKKGSRMPGCSRVLTFEAGLLWIFTPGKSRYGE